MIFFIFYTSVEEIHHFIIVGADVAKPPSNESLQEGSTMDNQEVCPHQYSQLGCRDKELENYCTTRLAE